MDKRAYVRCSGKITRASLRSAQKGLGHQDGYAQGWGTFKLSRPGGQSSPQKGVMERKGLLGARPVAMTKGDWFGERSQKKAKVTEERSPESVQKAADQQNAATSGEWAAKSAEGKGGYHSTKRILARRFLLSRQEPFMRRQWPFRRKVVVARDGGRGYDGLETKGSRRHGCSERSSKGGSKGSAQYLKH